MTDALHKSERPTISSGVAAPSDAGPGSCRPGVRVREAPAPRLATRAYRRRTSWRTRLEITLFAGPALVVYVGFVLLPVGLAAYYSLYKWNGVQALTNFVGLDNYARALKDPVFLAQSGTTRSSWSDRWWFRGPSRSAPRCC